MRVINVQKQSEQQVPPRRVAHQRHGRWWYGFLVQEMLQQRYTLPQLRWIPISMFRSKAVLQHHNSETRPWRVEAKGQIHMLPQDGAHVSASMEQDDHPLRVQGAELERPDAAGEMDLLTRDAVLGSPLTAGFAR